MIQRQSPCKISMKKKEPRPIIRSPAFKRKYEDGMPRINQKAIPFHNFYDVEIGDVKVAK